MNRPHVLIHPSDMAQSDWVRCILPFMQFMGANAFQIAPSITHITCTYKSVLKQTRAVIIQRPTASGRMETALAYAALKKECGFKLITDFDDLIWDLSPIIQSYAKGINNYDNIIMTRLDRVLPIFDTVVCATQYLADRMKNDFGINAIVMPNGVSRSLFGLNDRTTPFIGKPKVMYAGNLGHYTDGDIGDFEGPWVPWLRKVIESGTIDFYCFGEPPFLKDLKKQYTSIPYTSIMEFPSTAANIHPDFYIAPLADNNFNRAKSDLKLKEAAALGAVFIGSDFDKSPYSYAPTEQLIKNTDSPDVLDEKFRTLCNPDSFMKAIHWQKQSMEEQHWLYEDPEFQKEFISTHT